MPRYFFDVYDGREALRDEFGVEAEGVDQAADEAAALLPGFAREALPGGQSWDFVALVRDEAGQVVYRAALLFRGERPRPAGVPPGVKAADVASEMHRAARLRGEARDLETRLRANMRELMATLDRSKELQAARRADGPRTGRSDALHGSARANRRATSRSSTGFSQIGSSR